VIAIPPEKLTLAVAAIAQDVSARVALRATSAYTEERLWWELSCCILSSQVPYTLASAAADAIQERRSLLQPADCNHLLVLELEAVLRGRLNVGEAGRAYRFATSRARQLALTRSAIAQAAGDLVSLLARLGDAVQLRSWLVQHAPGVGPKQASMFLRNCGVSYDLAILDRHVVWYMVSIGLVPAMKRPISKLSTYAYYEQTLRLHACEIGHPVGILDWAIWIVARAARRLSSEDGSR
jgi:N-glycosylase/DNA lyase